MGREEEECYHSLTTNFNGCCSISRQLIFSLFFHERQSLRKVKVRLHLLLSRLNWLQSCSMCLSTEENLCPLSIDSLLRLASHWRNTLAKCSIKTSICSEAKIPIERVSSIMPKLCQQVLLMIKLFQTQYVVGRSYMYFVVTNRWKLGRFSIICADSWVPTTAWLE
jgi:hypothetical protein